MEQREPALTELWDDLRLHVVDIADFNERVVGAYNENVAEKGLAADEQVARSVVPAGTGAFRDFSFVCGLVDSSRVQN